MSQTLVQRPTPVHRFPSREVIDVDDLIPGGTHTYIDDDDIQFIGHRQRSLSHGHEPIVIGDSDDDIEIVAGPSRPQPPHNGRAGRNQPIHRPNRRALFSPSPPPQDNRVPPVPPIPPHFGFARGTPPLRYRPPPDIDLRGVVRPMEQPFGFEQGLHAQPQLAPEQDAHRIFPNGMRANAAARPNIALGGGMLALNRRNQFEPVQPARPRSENNGGWRGLLGNFGLAAYRMFFQGDEGSPEPMIRDMNEDRDLLEALALNAEEHQQDLQFRLIHHHRPFARRHGNQQQQRRQEEPIYKPTFTHPAKPEPGFSNDFVSQEIITISDEPGPSSTHETGTVLVCAMCLDPLEMNVVGSEEEIRKRKLFALRCGHIIDGKCIDSIMKPPSMPSEHIQKADEETIASSNKGKGKAKADVSELLKIENEEPSLSARRDKGKQKAVGPEDEGALSSSIPTKRSAPGSEDYMGPAAYTRSRLRPRHSNSGASSASLTAVTPSVDQTLGITSEGHLENAIPPTIDAPPPNTRSRRSASGSMPLFDPVLHGPTIHSVDYAVQSAARRRPGRPRGRVAKGRARGKGKGKVPPVIIEAEHEWVCPVASCGHKHKSVRIEGVWRMDETQGAITMYV